MARLLKFTLLLALVFTQVSPIFAETAGLAGERVESSLKWRSRVIPIAISTSLLRSAPNVKAGSDLVGALRRSLRTWEEASGIEFREVMSDKQNVSPSGVAGDGISLITIAPTAENALLFGKNADEVAATTRVFFDAKGRISEADIVLNPYQQFSTDGTFGSFDAESTFAHEIGHVLGLEHSDVRGSVMYENFGKNGVFNLQGFGHRTLSEIDRTVLRAKYGPIDDAKCCGTISTRFLLPEGRPAANVEAWVEEPGTGKVVSQTLTKADGTAEFSGLTMGSYVVFSGRKDRQKKPIPAQTAGTVTLSTGADAVSITKKLDAASNDIDVSYTGFNGQLTMSAVPVDAGKSYTVYLGGKGLTTNTAIAFSSPYLSVTPNSIAVHDYGTDISVLSFEVAVDTDAPIGEYTIFAASAAGGKAAVVGGLSVRSFNNPFSNFTLETKNF